MASTIKVDQIEGSTGSTITVPTGQTLTLTDGLASASLPVVGVAKGGTSFASFTAGDVLYATGSTTLAKLAKGTAEQVLAMNAGATAPDWGSVDLTVLPTITVAKGGTNLSSFTAGDILYATGATTLAKLAKGTAAQQLAMNAGATAPEWVTASTGGTYSVHAIDSYNYQTAVTVSSTATYHDIAGGNYVQFQPTSTDDFIYISHGCFLFTGTANAGQDIYMIMNAGSSSITSSDTKLNFDGSHAQYANASSYYHISHKSFLSSFKLREMSNPWGRALLITTFAFL